MWSSGPNTYVKPGLDASLTASEVGGRRLSIWHTLPIDGFAITMLLPKIMEEVGEAMFSEREIFPVSAWDNPVLPDPEGASGFMALVERLSLTACKIWWGKMRTRPENGRFGVKLEGAGQKRVFAICNPLFQTLLRPLHDWCMSVLRLLPTDGTFDQLKPLSRLKGQRELFSYDLKSATDLLPVYLSACLLRSIFGDWLSQSWMTLMSSTAFRAENDWRSIKRGKANVYRFTKGQPLGFSSSWPVFTLTHHALVWLAAWNVRPGKLFLDYAILGDDLVIADTEVAEEYLRILSECEVTISKEKSLISHVGACEFAKRFMVDKVERDFSPFSCKIMSLFGGFVPAIHYHVFGVDFRTSVRLRGGGYRAASQACTRKRSFKWERHWLNYALTSSKSKRSQTGVPVFNL